MYREPKMIAEVSAMCLGIPGQVISITGDTATVDFWGTFKQVRVDTIDVELVPGDHIISHTGVAVRRLAAEDVADTYALYEAVLSEAGEDPVVRAVLAELEHEEELVLVPA
jgi:hydrogenase expression/formation protein HypC